MDAQTFMYFALGAGFLLLVLFLCIAIYHLIRILKDVADTTDTVKDTAEKIDESITKITAKVNDAADQITEYVVKPFTVIQYIAEKAKPVMDILQKKGIDLGKFAGEEEEEEERPRKKRRFGRKK